MADVQPPAPPPLPIEAVPKPPATAVILNPPETITRLPVSSILIATVVGPPSDGQVTILTAHGKVLLQTPLPLPESGTLELQIQRPVTPVLVLIKSLDGAPLNQQTVGAGQQRLPFGHAGTGGKNPETPAQPPSSATNPVARSASGLPPIASSSPASAATAAQTGQQIIQPQLEIGTVLKATLLPQSVGNGSNIEQIRQGSSGPSIATGNNSSAVGPRISAVAAGYGAAQSAGAKPASPQPVAQSLTVRVVVVSPPAGAFSTPQPISGGNSNAPTENLIRGVVVGQRTGGQPLVQVPGGILSLETNITIRPGTELQLQTIEPSPRATPPNPHLRGIGEMFELRAWPALDEAISHVQNTQPTATQQFLNGTVPQPNTQLTTNILFFLTALRGGDLRQWLTGAPMRSLERDRPELLGRMNDDFGQLSRIFNESPQSDWRTALVPFLNGAQLEQIRMFSRGRRGAGDTDDEDEDQARFVIDVNLSRLGRVQLDGLVKTKEKQFDLYLRTDGPLPTRMRRDITAIFTASAEATGVAGRLVYQGGGEFVEIPHPQDKEPVRSGVLV